VLALAYRKLTWGKFRKAAIGTLQISSMVIFLGVASNVFGAVFARLGSADMITNTLLALPVSPFIMLLIIMVLIFLLGWPFEWPAIIYLFLPIFMPLVLALKFDLVWFGILTAVNLQTAFLSPPVAMAAYYLKAVVPEWELSTIYGGMAQFMILQVIALLIVMIFPEIALWFPRWLFS
jgi:TRAP-type mannitol/chloroaromatic compound transport system permease large subunit